MWHFFRESSQDVVLLCIIDFFPSLSLSLTCLICFIFYNFFVSFQGVWSNVCVWVCQSVFVCFLFHLSHHFIFTSLFSSLSLLACFTSLIELFFYSFLFFFIKARFRSKLFLCTTKPNIKETFDSLMCWDERDVQTAAPAAPVSSSDKHWIGLQWNSIMQLFMCCFLVHFSG